jgi:hypothetical protein
MNSPVIRRRNIDRYAISGYSYILGKDQNNQTISKYTNKIQQCADDCNNNNNCAGMVINKTNCWTIKSFPNPYTNNYSVMYTKIKKIPELPPQIEPPPQTEPIEPIEPIPQTTAQQTQKTHPQQTQQTPAQQTQKTPPRQTQQTPAQQTQKTPPQQTQQTPAQQTQTTTILDYKLYIAFACCLYCVCIILLIVLFFINKKNKKY